MKRIDVIGVVLVATATVAVGASVGVSSLIAHYPPAISQAARYAIGATVLFMLLRRRGLPLPRVGRREVVQLVALALSGLVGFNLCLLAALRSSEPAGVGVIVGCVPLVLGIVGPLMRGDMPGRRMLVAAVIVTLGAAVTQGAVVTSAPGLLFSLGTLVGEALFSLLAVSLLPRIGPMALSAYLCSVAGITFVVIAPVVDGSTPIVLPTLPQVAAIGFLGLAVTGGAFVAWYAGLARLGVERAGLFAGLIPISSLFSGVILGTGALSLPRMAGVCLVAAGVTLGLMTTVRTRETIPAEQVSAHSIQLSTIDR